MPEKSFRSLHAGLIPLLLVFLLSACTVSGVTTPPTTSAAIQATAPVATALPGQAATPAENVPPAPLTTQDVLATREAALGGSGKPGPTLPPGDTAQLPGQLTPTPTPTSTAQSADASGGGVAQPGQARSTPGGAAPSMSPDQLATQEAALGESAKPAPASPANCLRGVGLVLLLPAAGLLLRRRLLPR